MASRSLMFPWRQAGGDWVDVDGTVNGPNSAAQFAMSGTANVSIDVTAIVKRLLVDNTGILLHKIGNGTAPKFASRETATPPLLTVATDAGTVTAPCIADCYMDASSNKTLGGAYTQPPGILVFDLSEVRGMLQSATLALAPTNWYGPVTIAADYVDMPVLITEPARQVAGARNGIAANVTTDRDLAAHPDIVFYSECSSEAAIKAKWSFVSPNYPGKRVCINPQFVHWPEVDLTALRMESQWPGNMIPGDSGSSILTWREYPAAGRKYADLYVRYLMRIDPDVYAGMNELGVKLPGFEGDGFSYRMEHGAQSQANPDVFRLIIYAYDATRPFDDPNRGSVERRTSVCMKTGNVYCIEQHVRVNTVAADGSANRDGLIEIFVDGVLVYADTQAQVTKSANAGITSIPFANFYHGGTGVPRAPIHYEFSGVAVSPRYIGPPKRRPTTRSSSAWPTWRRHIAIGQVAAIAGSSMALLNANNANAINAWTGLAAGAVDWYSAANGGHRDSSDNGVYRINLGEDAPRWTVLRPASSAQSIPSLTEAAVNRLEHYRDGRPAARHSYYSSQVIAARNRVMLFYCAAPWGDGNANDPVVDAFRLNDLDWDSMGTWRSGPVRKTIAQCVAKHPATEDVYCAMDGQFAKWMQVTGEWSTLQPTPATPFQFCGSAIDAVRNRWVFSSGNVLSCIDLATLALTRMELPGFASEAKFDIYNNIVHDTINDRYVVCCTDGRVYAIDPDSGATAKLLQLPAAKNGVQNRFAYFAALGGIAYYPEFRSDILFLAVQ